MDLIDILLPEVGIKESPPNSNNVKYNTWFYGKPVSGKEYSWCMVLMSWGLFNIGKPLVKIKDSDNKLVNFGYAKGAAGCSTALQVFKQLGWIIAIENAQRNDLVFYDWDGNGAFDHVEAFMNKLGSNTFETIGGNTSIGNNSDGGEVLRRPDRKYNYGNEIKMIAVRIPDKINY